MNETKIGKFEAISLILSVIINHLILNLPQGIISTTGSASSLNLLFISILAVLFTLLIVALLKKFPNLDILDISKFLGGTLFKNIVGILFLLYFLFISSLLLRSFSESLKIIYLQRTPITIILLLFIIAIIIVNKLGFKAMCKSTLIIMPITIISIFFIFFANIPHFVPQNIFPILGYGIIPTFFSGLSNLFAFSGIAFLYFLPPKIESKDVKKIAITSVVLSSVFLLFSITSILFLFSIMNNTEDIMSLYLASRYITFGRFFQRLDAIFLLIWILSITSYLSIVLSFCIYIFKKTTQIENSKPMIYCFGILMFITSLLPKNIAQLQFFEIQIFRYLTIGLVFIISSIILILANLKFKRLHKKEGDIIV